MQHYRRRSEKLSQHNIRHDKEITHILQIIDVKEKVSTKKFEDELSRGKSVSDSSLFPISVPVEKLKVWYSKLSLLSSGKDTHANSESVQATGGW